MFPTIWMDIWLNKSKTKTKVDFHEYFVKDQQILLWFFLQLMCVTKLNPTWTLWSLRSSRICWPLSLRSVLLSHGSCTPPWAWPPALWAPGCSPWSAGGPSRCAPTPASSAGASWPCAPPAPSVAPAGSAPVVPGGETKKNYFKITGAHNSHNNYLKQNYDPQEGGGGGGDSHTYECYPPASTNI